MSVTPITIELVGGPRDGEIVALRRWVPEWHLERWNGPRLAFRNPDDTARPIQSDTLRGIYRCRPEQPTGTNPLLYDWQGWS